MYKVLQTAPGTGCGRHFESEGPGYTYADPFDDDSGRVAPARRKVYAPAECGHNVGTAPSGRSAEMKKAPHLPEQMRGGSGGGGI